ncbi:MAG: YfhO family protein [Chloroflexota bacterium]|nr:YfhO family protein [Chloroflexota bacterium]
MNTTAHNHSVSPLTRRELAWAILLWGALVSLFLGPALLTGRVLSPADLLYDYAPWAAHAPSGWGGASNGLLSDDVLMFEPWFQAGAARLHAGALPLWQPDSMLGAPLIGNMQSAVFDPLNWPYFLWPDPALLVVRAWFKLFLLALGMYVLARDTLRVRPLAAAVAVVTFTFGAFVTVWLLYPLTAVVVWLPWLWWTTARLLARPRPRALVGVAALVTLTLLAGQPEMAYQIALGTGLFALLVAWQAAPRQWGRIAGRLGLWGLAYGLGTAGAAIQLGPFLEYLSQSSALISRSGAAAVDPGLPFRYFWTAFVPDLFGNPAQHNWWATVSNYNETNLYCGLLPWLLAPFALCRRDRHTRALAGLLIAASLVALGTVYGWPLIRAAVQTIPLMPLAAGGRLVLLVQFALALLAALGAEALLDRLADAPGRRLPALGAILLGLGGLAPAFPALTAQGVFLLPADSAATATWTAALTRTAAVLLPTGALLAALLVLGPRRPRWGRAALLGALVLLAADLGQIHGSYNPTIDRAAYYPATPLTAFLRAQPGLFRYAALGWTLMPNTNLRYGLANFAGYDALLPRPYHQAVVRIDPQVPAVGYTPYHILQSPLLNLFNVRYLIAPSSYDPNTPADPLVRPTDLPAGAAAGRWFQPIWAGDGVTVYENRRVLPRAWLTHQATVEADSAHRLALLTSPAFDGATTALLDAPLPPDQPLPSVSPPATADAVAVRRYDPEAVDIAGSSPAAGLLILADQAFPGWTATVDGRPAAIHTADHALRGVYVPAGSHLVQFRYQPASLRWGAAISGVAGLVALGLIALPRRRRRHP